MTVLKYGIRRPLARYVRENPPYEVRSSHIQGQGVFAIRPIRKGTRVIEYVGDIIDSDEEDRRYDDAYMDRHHTFLFRLDEDHTIDAAVGGNDAMFINHSCEPNCEALDDDGRIFIFAKRSIRPGEELTYDYQFDVDPPITRSDVLRYPCFCGTDTCRGTILNVSQRKLASLKLWPRERIFKAVAAKKKRRR